MTMVFQQKTGLKFNVIPQPGTAGFIVSQVAGGHAEIGVASCSPSKPMIDAGMVNLLAVFAPSKAPGYEKIPTLKELGYDLGVGSFGVFVGPPKMPRDIVEKLDKAFEAGVNDADYQKFMNENHYTGHYLNPEKAKRFMDEQREIYRPAMREAGILKEK
jgi:tripartite-type tricarboxylate transporter receptor subunit TctC